MFSTIDESCFDRILNDIRAVLQKALSINDPHLRKPALPHLSLKSKLPLQTIRKSALNKLHGLFDANIARKSHQQMHVIRHDHEVMHLKLTRSYIRPQHVDEKHCIPFRHEALARSHLRPETGNPDVHRSQGRVNARSKIKPN